MSRFLRLLLEEGGWGKVWTGLGMAIALAGGGLIYQQTQTGGGGDSDCPLPAFPDETCTGVPSGTSLTAYSGPTTITVADTIIDSKIITSGLSIQTTGVIIRNSLFDNPDTYAVQAIQDPDATAVTIEDSTIDGGNDNGGTGIWGSDIIARRNDIYGWENGFSLDNDNTIEDNYVHDLYQQGASHTDGIQFASGCCSDNNDIIHNRISAISPEDEYGTSAIISNGGGSGFDTNILIQDNLLEGGGWTIYCTGWQSGSEASYEVIDNWFDQTLLSTVGSAGPSTGCDGVTQSGNKYYPSGNPVTLG